MPSEGPVPRLRVRRRLLMLGTVVAALALPAIAGAWAQYYVVTQVFAPGGVEVSGWNYDLTENEVLFADRYSGAVDWLGTNLCAGGCYEYWWWYEAGGLDPRDISYGYAKCTAYNGNGRSIDVNFCWTRNIH